jgi:hypothetical protein
LKDYFSILHISDNADLDDVKRAYRTLAKKYHPDKNASQNAANLFVEINEAYEFLSDPTRLKLYKARKVFAAQAKYNRQRDEVYQAWVSQQRDLARRRAESSAHKSYSEFVNSPVYRAAMVANNVYNYIFVGVGLLMVLSPLHYLTAVGKETLERLENPTFTILAPSILGVGFTVLMYKMLFVNNRG